jgi:carbon storage regulator
MLVLARKVGEQIVVDESIEITVLEVRGEVVRLGITAPRTVTINRKELLDQMAKEAFEESQ